MSSMRTTSMSLLSWLVICRITASEPLVTSVSRETVASSVGATDSDGTACTSQSYVPGDVWATVAHAMGISLTTVHTSKNGRPMKIANGGTPIKELIG